MGVDEGIRSGAFQHRLTALIPHGPAVGDTFDSMEQIWNDLYEAALGVLKPRIVSRYIEVGSVAAAIESSSGRIYTGICVDTACSLGLCAERNAIFSMLTAGEDGIRRVIAIGSDGKAVPPCGSCMELMFQLMPDSCRSIQIMLDYGQGRIVTLSDLAPAWWQ